MSYEKIPGYSGFLKVYDRAVAAAKDGAVFVEVGVALGHSIAYLARSVLDSGKIVEVYAVDPWEGVARNGEQQAALGERRSGDFGLFVDAMRENCPEEFEIVRVLRMTSQRAARFFEPRSLDLVLIDGAHDYDSVSRDIAAWLPKMKRGGILAGDDHEPNYPGVERAAKQAFGGAYDVEGTAWFKVCS